MVELLAFMDRVFASFSSNLDSLIMIAHYYNECEPVPNAQVCAT